ncbi:MAG: GxxExxY protein [Parcubacteria group bacterium]|nr:GxxExxY protein [Parcubacteria group bacterium]
MANKKVNDLVFGSLSYKIVGAAFNVFNILGYGMNEKYYQKAFAKELDLLNIPYKREEKISLDYKGSKLGSYVADFIVDDKVVVEFKVRPRLGYTYIKQVNEYLGKFNKKLALIIYFNKNGVHFRRVLNPNLKNY